MYPFFGPWMRGLLILGLGAVLITSLGASSFKKDETVGERFRKAIAKIEKDCASRKLDRGEVCGEVAKLKPADPLATEEGRFAHSIKIPNPVPEDSGYKPGMTSQEYFDRLCKTEAGEFVFKAVSNVEGVYQMRPRPSVTFESNHLYAIEDPYGGPYGSNQPEIWFVGPDRYRFFESPDLLGRQPDGFKEFIHPSYSSMPPKDSKVARYFGHDGKKQQTIQKEYDTARKSIYGYTWRGISRPHDREMGVAGSELLILDLKTNEVLGVHRGYARFDIDRPMIETASMQWRQRCPIGPNMGGGSRLAFVLKVLTPISASQKK